MLTAAAFRTTETGSNPNVPVLLDGAQTGTHPYKGMRLGSKGDKPLTVTTTWTDLECLLLSESSPHATGYAVQDCLHDMLVKAMP